MPSSRYPHLFLPGPTSTRDDYSSPRRGGDGPRLRDQDRPVHAAHIQSALQTAWTTAKDKQAVAHASNKGIYLEFQSEPNCELALKSLESKQQGIRLLNVHTSGEGENAVIRASVSSS